MSLPKLRAELSTADESLKGVGAGFFSAVLLLGVMLACLCRPVLGTAKQLTSVSQNGLLLA